jgi:hypothetical protein
MSEAIDQRGFDVHYIVRDLLNPDYIFGESSMSNFTEFYLIPMYLESMEHFSGSGDIWDGFGQSLTDSAIFRVSVKTFKLKVEDQSNIPRPREGDLVYVPFTDSLWEVNLVKLDDKYYQTGINHSYRLICKLFSYSHETIETNTNSDFNKLGTSELDAGLRNMMGLTEADLHEESSLFIEETKKTTSSNDFDANNPFSY